MTFTNVTADAVNTIEWLSPANTSIAVPVYQRQYRWEIDACEQLLADIRAVAKGDARHTHFFGSILFAATSSAEVTERMLVDGQQRVATLMLLVAALRDTLGSADEAIAGPLRRVLLLNPTRTGRTRLRLRREGARELDSIIFGGPMPDVRVEVSHLRDNYDFFLRAIQSYARAVWDGLQKLEHVAITLQEHANPQQISESLNSTGAPLKDHELIHNYVLMGLSYSQQTELEDSFWIHIEQNTGDAIDKLPAGLPGLENWAGQRVHRRARRVRRVQAGVPGAAVRVADHASAEWKEYSEVYRTLLDPAWDDDEEVGRQLRYINTIPVRCWSPPPRSWSRSANSPPANGRAPGGVPDRARRRRSTRGRPRPQ